MIVTRLDRGNRRCALDATPEPLQMGEEDLLGTPLGQTALEFIRAIDAGEAARRERDEPRPAHP